MKRTLAALVALASGTAGADAFLSGIFNPSMDTLTTLCQKANDVANTSDAISRIEKASEATQGLYANFRPSANARIVRFQSPAASTFNICRSRAEKLQAPLTGDGLKNNIVLLYVEGRVTELRFARDHRAAFVFLDDQGKEIARYNPYNSELGDSNNWKVSCSSSPCTWSGQNIFYFRASPEFLDSAAKARAMQILVSRGNGIERFEIAVDNPNGLK